jgi:hypothetical protein
MDQYSSPKIWGPHFWFIMRCVANNYPINPNIEDSRHVKNFFSELQYILPCEICKYTYRQHIKRYPIDNYLSSRDKLVEWVEDIHEYTKKVISDRRVKVMDQHEEQSGEIKPIKVVYKTKKSELENKLESVVNSVKSKETKVNKIEIFKQPPEKKQDARPVKLPSEIIKPAKLPLLPTQQPKPAPKPTPPPVIPKPAPLPEKPVKVTNNNFNARLKNLNDKKNASKELILTRRCKKCEY